MPVPCPTDIGQAGIPASGTKPLANAKGFIFYILIINQSALILEPNKNNKVETANGRDIIRNTVVS